jgi:hypothetical protein
MAAAKSAQGTAFDTTSDRALAAPAALSVLTVK